jgi:hypothetical protein
MPLGFFGTNFSQRDGGFDIASHIHSLQHDARPYCSRTRDLDGRSTLPGTIAHLEATRAAMFAALLCILTAPWLIIAAIVLY